MAKINDTTTFPNTAPALGDHVIGTDVSNVTNDAAGETVSFTWQSVMDLMEANMTVPGSVSAAYRTSTILSSTSNAEGAALIGVEDAGTYFAGATVEAVLAEIGALLPAEANADVTDETNVLAALSGATLTEVDPAATDKILILDADDTFNIKNVTWSDVTAAAAAATPEGTAILSGGPVTDGYVLTADGLGGAAWEAAATGTPEGTAILSTGEVGGTKFLREDGDGTCSWQTPAGGGDVSAGGSPASTYIGVWTDGTTLTGTSGLTYGSSILEFTGGLLLNERADHAATFPNTGKAELWLSNDTTQKLYLTSDDGTDNEIAFLTGSGDLSSFTGIVGISASSAVDVNTKALLEARLSDVSDLAEADGDVYSGVHDFGGATLEIPNGATPTIDAAGEIAIDTTVADWSHGILEYFSGEAMGVVAMPIAQFTTPTDGYVVAYNATNDEFELVANSGSGLSNVVEDTTPQLGGMLDVNGQALGDGTLELLKFSETASAVNEITITNAATLNHPSLSATGDDADINLNLVAKGTGVVTAGGVEVVTLTGTQTLTSKTLTSPVLGSTVTGTYTLGGTPTFPSTLSMSGGASVIRSGAHALTLTTTGTTDVTFPTTGTLATTAVTTLGSLTSIQGHTVTLTGDFIRSGAHSLTLTTGGATNVTLPTTGTLAAYGDTTANFTGTLQNGGSNVVVDTDIGSTVQAFDADTLKADTSDNLTAGFTSSVDDDGSKSGATTYAPDPATGNYKQIENAGAFTLNPPSPANDIAVSVSVLIINHATTAGTITTSNFTQVTGDSFDTTGGNKFLCRIDVYDDGGTEYSLLQVVALQ